MLDSYAGFLLALVVPPTLVLAVAVKHRGALPRAAEGIGLLAAIAVAYTTPWDNYLVARGVWGYPADAVLAVIGHAPVSEYAFFVLQPVLAGLWLHVLDPEIGDAVETAPWTRAAGAGMWLAVAAVGGVLLTTGAGYYLGAILAWAGPVLALQWGVGGPALVRHRRLVALAVAVPTLYLWVIDRIAIGIGLWELSPAFTTGAVMPVLGLPIEEAVFFLVTNLLVVQGLVLFHWVLAVVARGTTADGLAALVAPARVGDR